MREGGDDVVNGQEQTGRDIATVQGLHRAGIARRHVEEETEVLRNLAPPRGRHWPIRSCRGSTAKPTAGADPVR